MGIFAPEPGLVVSGRYRLESLLGQGGMGSVWRAHHLTLNAPVAVKLIDPALASSADAQARFIREAQAAAALRSPNVVQTLDFGVDEGVPYIVMELLVGESLADRLARQGRLDGADTARIIVEIAKAIGKAHAAEIVHRDLKPDNVFLARDEDEEIVKVVDFGVAKATGMVGASTSKTRTGAILGTPYYMSPEQAQGDKRVDWRTDLWALAVITFECLVGRRPFEADGLGSLIMQICISPIPVPSQHGPVPAGFDAWWAKATERDPAQRFQSARELATSLREVLLGAEAHRLTGEGFGVGPARRESSAGTYGGAPIAPAPTPFAATPHPAPTPYPDLSGSESGHSTVAIDTSSGSPRLTTDAAQATTTGAVATDGAAPRRQGRVGLVLVVAAGVLALGGVAAAAVAVGLFGSVESPTPAASAAADLVEPEGSPSAEPESPESEDDAVAPTPAEPTAASAASVAATPAPSAPAVATPPPRPVPVPRLTTTKATAAATPTRTPPPPPPPPPRRDRLGF